jgi:hypothetical protein
MRKVEMTTATIFSKKNKHLPVGAFLNLKEVATKQKTVTDESQKTLAPFETTHPSTSATIQSPTITAVEKTGIKVKHEALKSPLFLSAHQNGLADSQAGTSSKNIELQPSARSESSNDEQDTTRPLVIPRTPAVQNLLVKKSGKKSVEIRAKHSNVCLKKSSKDSQHLSKAFNCMAPQRNQRTKKSDLFLFKFSSQNKL